MARIACLETANHRCNLEDNAHTMVFELELPRYLRSSVTRDTTRAKPMSASLPETRRPLLNAFYFRYSWFLVASVLPSTLIFQSAKHPIVLSLSNILTQILSFSFHFSLISYAFWCFFHLIFLLF